MSMRPTSVRLVAAGYSAWIPLNWAAIDISILIGLVFSSNKNLTANVQYVSDPLVPQKGVNITRSTTTATLKLTNHGLSVDDSVVVSDAPAPFAGVYTVASVVDQNTITYTVANSGAASATDASAIPMRVQPHPVLTTITADADSNFAYPPTAVRLYVSSYTAGYVDMNIVSGSW